MSDENIWKLGFIENNPDFTYVLGVFIARWSLVEMALVMPLVRVSNISQEMATGILASTAGTKAKINLVRIAVKQSLLPDDEKIIITKILGTLEQLCTERDEIAHHVWTSSEDGSVSTFDYRRTVGDPNRRTERSLEWIVELRNKSLETAASLCEASRSSLFLKEG